TKFGSAGTISVVASADQTYNDAVTLQGNTTFIAPALAFNGSPVSIDALGFNLTIQSNAASFAGGANSVQGTGDLALLPLLDTDAIVIGRPDPAPVTANTLFLDLTSLQTFKDGFNKITIGSATGSHAITISSNS